MAKITSLGLYHNGVLVAVAQFCSPRTAAMKRKYTVELLRMAFASYVRVPGGASKLMSAYRRLYNPSDIFTYQDMAGEATSVYEHCGFTLISQAKTKSYLVAPGKTLATASRKEALGMAYAVRYGPDRILGAKLGEVRDTQGRRLTNPELFEKKLGWHVETTPGDRVYEWINPAQSFYTYRITAASSARYYIGVKRILHANATLAQCLADGYWGSGGKGVHNKFRLWKAKHKDELFKEILAVYSRSGEAFKAEKDLVGDRWKTDPLCLNSRPGGAVSPPSALEAKLRSFCEKHGERGFIGGRCRSCMLEEQETLAPCRKHGNTSHFSGHCRKCLYEKSIEMDTCEIHGDTTFQKGSCLKCLGSAKIALLRCKKHGETKHMGKRCALCEAEKRFTTKECTTHGLTSFVGSKCVKCIHSNTFELKECPVHGLSKHKGSSCSRCARAKAFSKQSCAVHGESTFQGDSCMKCRRVRKR